MNSHFYSPATFTLAENARYALGRRLNVLEAMEERKISCNVGNRAMFFGCPALSLVSISAGLSRLAFNGVSTVHEVYLIKHGCVQVSFLCLPITRIKLILRSSSSGMLRSVVW